MRKTDFAGLTELDAGEPLTTDGGSFTARDRTVIDHFLKVGAKTHRHDGHAGLADPTIAPTMTAQGAGGNLAPDTTVTACYTLLDPDGGETLPSPVGTVTTPAVVDPPSTAPTATIDYTAGGLLVDTYAYLLTLTDDAGGETPAGPAVTVVRQPGSATAQITLSDLATAVTDTDGATGWRLYRAKGASEFEFLASGDAFTDAFLDDGATSLVYDQSPPPDNNTTNATAQVTVRVPSTAVAASNGWRLYVAIDGDFTSPSLVGGDRPPSDAGTDIVIGELAPDDGAPPDVSTSVGGAAKVVATRDIDWTGYAFPSGPGGGAALVIGDLLAWNDDQGQPAVALQATENWKQVIVDHDDFDGTHGVPVGFTKSGGQLYQSAAMLSSGEMVAKLPDAQPAYEGVAQVDYAVTAENYSTFGIALVIGGPNNYGLYARVRHSAAPPTLELAIVDASGLRVLASANLNAFDDYDQNPHADMSGFLYIARSADAVDVWLSGNGPSGGFNAETTAVLEGADLAAYGTNVGLYPAMILNNVVADNAVTFDDYQLYRSVGVRELDAVIYRNGGEALRIKIVGEDGTSDFVPPAP